MVLCAPFPATLCSVAEEQGSRVRLQRQVGADQPHLPDVADGIRILTRIHVRPFQDAAEAMVFLMFSCFFFHVFQWASASFILV